MNKKVGLCLAVCMSVLAVAQEGQRAESNSREWREMARIRGTVVSVQDNELVIKPQTGENVTVKVTPETRIRKDRAEAKLTGFKPGDQVVVAGTEGSDKVLNARFITGGEMAFRAGMRRGGTMGSPPPPEELAKMGLGTKFIAGEVKSIDGTRLTIARIDGQEQTIEVDEDTSFRNGKGENSTLADMKVGDRIMGRGEVKAGVFVPQTLRFGTGVGMMGVGRGPRRPGGPPTQEQPK